MELEYAHTPAYPYTPGAAVLTPGYAFSVALNNN
jgi:hypothetical protein